MNRVFMHLINPILNVCIMFALLALLLNIDWAFTLGFIIPFFSVSVIVNAVTFMFSYEKAAFKYYFSSIGLFLVLVLLYLAFKLTIGNPDSQGDQGNIAEGLVLIVVFFISLLSIVFGNVIGFFVKKYLKR